MAGKIICGSIVKVSATLARSRRGLWSRSYNYSNTNADVIRNKGLDKITVEDLVTVFAFLAFCPGDSGNPCCTFILSPVPEITQTSMKKRRPMYGLILREIGYTSNNRAG